MTMLRITAGPYAFTARMEEADAHAITVIREMREAVRAADEAGDPGTADVFSRFVQIHERHEWWLRDILRQGDGLCS